MWHRPVTACNSTDLNPASARSNFVGDFKTSSEIILEFYAENLS